MTKANARAHRVAIRLSGEECPTGERHWNTAGRRTPIIHYMPVCEFQGCYRTLCRACGTLYKKRHGAPSKNQTDLYRCWEHQRER